MNHIFKSTGIYIGFIANGFLFSRDGEYLGWIENTFVWDAKGRFRGQIWQEKYIIYNPFAVSPVPRTPRSAPQMPVVPPPPANIGPVTLPTGWADSF